MARVLAVLFVGLLSAGCVKKIGAPDVAANAATNDPQAAWARVLSTHVTDTGKIDFAALEKDATDLEAYVAWLAKNGPKTTPDAFQTKEAKMAYYLNAYNALCMYNAIENKVKPKAKIRFFLRTKLPMDGGEISLYDLENKIVRPMNEPRAHFILNCMVKGCPRLPKEPMRADALEGQLETAAKLFFSEEPRNVQVDDAKKVVRLSSILKFYTEDFVKPKTSHASLIEYANAYREKKIPVDYEVKFIPYDWTLNQS